MKKGLLLASLFAGSLFTMNAQTTILDVDFSSVEALSDWYIIDADGDGYNWDIETIGDPDIDALGFNGGFLFSASYDNNFGPLTPDNGLITESFTIPAGVTSAELTFKVGGIDENYFAEYYSVYAIEDSPIFQDDNATVGDIFALYSNANPLISETVASVNATTKTVSLNNFIGQTIRLVFRHHNITDVYYILLDDVNVSYEGTASVDSPIANSFSVYPNPTNDVLNIANTSGAELISVSVTDLNGRTVKQFNSSVEQINISDLNAGVYFVNINSTEGSLTKKIVKK